jgi:hypothetical protein
MPGINKHILDHEIVSTGNTKTLVFVDSSQYMENPERPLLEVTMPGFNKYFLVNYVANRVTTFNSSTLGLNVVLNQAHLVDLPDGVWIIKQKICPYDYINITKKYMKVDQLMYKLSNLNEKLDMASSELKNSKILNDDLIRVYNLIEGAKLVVNLDSKKATKYYDLANSIVQSYLNKICKNC